MVELGVLLLVLFEVWIGVANAIYVEIFGHAPAASIPDFATRVLKTSDGWLLIIVGCGVGFLLAVVALCVSVVSFPLMLDRHATAIDAIRTSLRAVMNPVAMAGWGVIVAALLVIGSIPLFVGLAVVLPVLGNPPGICTGKWWSRIPTRHRKNPTCGKDTATRRISRPISSRGAASASS